MRLYILSFLSTLILLACNIEENGIPTLEVGQEFTDSNVRILSIDTFSVQLSTFRFDSIITDGSDRILVGQYRDTTFGRTTATSYFEMTASSFLLDNDAMLDSVALILGYDRYFYNDTTQTSTISVHRLLDDVKPDEQFFYNTSQIEYEAFPLAVKRFRPEPFDEDSLHITLPMTFGEPLFDAIRDGDISSNEQLIQEFQGFTLRPGNNDDAAVIGFSKFDTETFLRFFYVIDGEFGTQELVYDITVNPTVAEEKLFNNISSDPTATLFQGLVDQETEIMSQDANNKGYMQSGSGLATKVSFPSIKTLNDIPGVGTLLSATLELSPPRAYFSDILPVRDSISVSLLDQNNDFIGELRGGDGVPVVGALDKERSEFNENVYTISVGNYIDQKLNESFDVEDALVLFPRDFTNSVDRMVINGEDNRDLEAKLILIYAIYDE